MTRTSRCHAFSWRFVDLRAGIVLGAAALLALEPLGWLLNSWRDPAYGSHGVWVALTVVALLVYSWSSRLPHPPNTNSARSMLLLLCAAIVRLLSQVLDISILGALTLVVDVYVLASLAGLNLRARPVAPFWLAALFFMSLPLERIVQRLVGFPLQLLSTNGACFALEPFATSLVCHGTQITFDRSQIVVDLACAGTATLHVSFFVFALLAALRLPSLGQACFGLIVTLIAAYLANVLRIVVLTLGVADTGIVFGVDVMRAPWHNVIGMVTMAMSVIPIWMWAQRIDAVIVGSRHEFLDSSSLRQIGSSIYAAAMLLAVAVTVVLMPKAPIDVAQRIPSPTLPAWLNGHFKQQSSLSAIERGYYTMYGGGASRAIYGDHTLLVVSTSSPLRHLHAPDECLRGTGHSVQYVGQLGGRFPTAIYRSVDPQGQAWRVAVSFVAEDGQHASSVGEVVWNWFRQPPKTWSLIERISPWSDDDTSARHFSGAVFAALDPLFNTTSGDASRHRLSSVGVSL